MNDPITPTEALDVLLEASNPELVGKVTREWLCEKQRGLPDRLALDSAHLDDEAKAAMAAVTTLKRFVREHGIRLWGRRDGKGDRIPIEDDQQQEGELLIWDATFEGPEIPDGPFKVRSSRYTDVRLVRSEVQAIADHKPGDIERAITIIEQELNVDAAMAGKLLIEAWTSREVEVWFQRAGLTHAWYTKPLSLGALADATIFTGRLIRSSGTDCETEHWVIRTNLKQLRAWLKNRTSVERVESNNEIADRRSQNIETKSERRVHVSGGRGRKPKEFWPQVEDHIKGLFEHHGPLSPDDPGWQTQADVERAILKFITDKGWSASESTIREHAVSLISKCSAKAGKAGN